MTRYEWLKSRIDSLDDSSLPWNELPCLIWPGFKLGNYGGVSLGRDPAYAHRTAWELKHGKIPHGLYVLHRCDVKLCFRPAHLFLGTHDDNMKDASIKGLMRAPNSKLTSAQVAQIKVALTNGAGVRKTARDFGMSRLAIQRIKSGFYWKHVSPIIGQEAASAR